MTRTAIGVDIGGTNIRAARVTSAGEIIECVRAPSSSEPEVALGRVVSLIEALDRPEVEAIGIGIPGQVDFAAQRVVSGGYVDFSCLPVCETLETRFGRHVTVDNDANMALIAESRIGAAAGLSEVAMLTIGTGIGGAILSNGMILRGAGSAGQLGHLVIDPQGRPCKCGRRGCVETVSSGTALGMHITEAGLAAGTTAADLLARRDAGDPVAEQALRAWASPLQAAINSLAATLGPQTIILGGGLGAAAISAISQFPETSSWFRYRVVCAHLGDDAGMIGSALSALAENTATGRRLVMVNGVPASGKSGIARALSLATGWPLLSLDTIKEPFLDEFDAVDRPFNRKLGRASLRAMFATLRAMPPSTTVIMDAWFGFQSRALLETLINEAGIEAIAEIWCSAPPDQIGARYAARASTRPPGHPGLDYVTELVALAGTAEPSRFGPVLEIDTTAPTDMAGLQEFLAKTVGAQEPYSQEPSLASTR